MTHHARPRSRTAVVAAVVAAVAGGTMLSATTTAAQGELAVDDAYRTGIDMVLEVAAPGVLANDAVAPGDPFDVEVEVVADAADGSVDLAADGSFSYTPDPGFVGTDTFTYELSNGSGDPVELHPDLAPPTVAARLGDEVVFFADDGVVGTELWATDGTVAGTRLVADINAGGVASDSIATERNADLVAFRDRLYFPADGPDGVELWGTDGTTAGTEQVADLVGGPDDARPSHLAVVDDTLLFWASTTGDRAGTEYRTLWAWTSGGPPLPQHTARPGRLVGHPSVVLDTGLVYAWNNELYRWSDGGTTIITPPSADENVGIVRAVEVGGQAVLELPDGQFAEDGVWFTDGVFVQEVVDDPTTLAGASDTHAFLQTPGTAPRSLDLAGTLTILPEPDDLAGLPDPDTTSAGNTARLGDRALLLGSPTLTSAGTPWISDGTTDGTERLLPDSTATTTFLGAARADGSVWFSLGGALYRSDGTPAGTVEVFDHGGEPGMVPVDGGSFLFHSLTGPDPGAQQTAWAIPYATGQSDTATVTITVADDTTVGFDEPVGVTDLVDVTVGAVPGAVDLAEPVDVDDDVDVVLGPTTIEVEVAEAVAVTDDVEPTLGQPPIRPELGEPVGVDDEVAVTLGPAPVMVEIDESVGISDANDTKTLGGIDVPGRRDGVRTFAIGRVDPAVVAPGDTVVFSGDGFADDSVVDITLFSDPVDLGDTAATEAGTIRVFATIPVATTPGPHELVAVGDGPDRGTHTVRGELTVRQPVQPADLPLPRTGAPLTHLAAVALALLLAGVTLRVAGNAPSQPPLTPGGKR